MSNNSEATLTQSEINELLIENRKMRKALEFIYKWELPMVEYQGEMISYEAARGSNGARDYIRKVAGDAIDR